MRAEPKWRTTKTVLKNASQSSHIANIMNNLKDYTARYEEFAAQFAALAEQLRECRSTEERIDVLEKTAFLIRKADQLIAEYKREPFGLKPRTNKAMA